MRLQDNDGSYKDSADTMAGGARNEDRDVRKGNAKDDKSTATAKQDYGERSNKRKVCS